MPAAFGANDDEFAWAINLKQQSFERLRQAEWQQLEIALGKTRRGYRLADTDPADFLAAYQNVARDLSVAKSRGYSRRLINRLNDLVVRGHNMVYVRRSGYRAGLIEYLRHGFPVRVRAHASYVLVAALLFFVPLFGMAVVVLNSPEWVYSVLPAQQVAELEAMYDPAALSLGRERQSDTDFRMFGFYIMNNIGIAFQVFASGLLVGLGSAFYLVMNGVFIGASAGHLFEVGYQQTFLTFTAGHGAFELTAIVLSGAAGLMLGHALIAPGNKRRADALRIAAHKAVGILFGAALMLVMAAFIEAFWSSISGVQPVIKYLVGAGLWVVVLGYLAGAGRSRISLREQT